MKLTPDFTGKDSDYLNDLLSRLRLMKTVETDIKALFPTNLRPHFSVVVGQDYNIVLFAAHTMAANRLKMLAPSVLPTARLQYENIRNIIVKLKPQPQPTPEPPSAPRRISAHGASVLTNTARNLQHHPQLAQALTRLAEKHNNNL